MDKETRQFMEEYIKKTAVQMAVPASTDLQDVIELFKKSNKEGKNICVVFQGVKLYALLDSEEDCYQKLYGRTKKELEEEDRQLMLPWAEKRAKYDDRFCHDIDDVIEYLSKKREEGENIYVLFKTYNKSFKFYSQAFTEDYIYLQVTEHTKQEYDDFHKKVDALKEASKGIIRVEDEVKWLGYIINSMEDPIRNGKDAWLALKVIELLKNGHTQEAHSVMSEADREFMFACSAVLKFAEGGREFYKEEMERIGIPVTDKKIDAMLNSDNDQANDQAKD